jgi:cyclase
MLKKRIIFILFYKDGYFHLSRNFRLQRVGDVSWLLDRFNFFDIGKYIDELIILNVSRLGDNTKAADQLRAAVECLMAGIFVPLTIGGGIRSLSDAAQLFEVGADKVAINWALLNDRPLVEALVKTYGSQAIIASVDVRRVDGKASWSVFVDGGTKEAADLTVALQAVQELNVGEILLTSIDKDGTAEGLDLGLYEATSPLDIPLIACGGVGRPDHVSAALMLNDISAVATGNLFNFIGSGFKNLRESVSQVYAGVRTL